MPRNSKIAAFYHETLELSGDVAFTRSMTTGIFQVTEAELAEILKEF